MPVGREPIRLDATPTDVLRALHDRPRLVALVGAGWSVGEAVIACDPVRELDTWDAVDLPRDDASEGFGGGWIGSWGYQLGGEVESLPPAPPRPIPTPALRVGFYDVVLRRVDGRWWLEWLDGADPERVASLRDAVTSGAAVRSFTTGPLALIPSPEEHRRTVARTIDHITAGDVFQVNVCARLEASFSGDPLDAFCAGVEQLSPAFAAYVRDEHGAIASWSPELFLRRRGDSVLTSPIKGTASLDADPAHLLASRKDRAENVMIVDLMRNDLGRVAEPGSVAVPALTRLERHAVWHLVSDVTAQVRAPDSALLRATFPPGSVTGAPKVRAMELVASELESTAREAYTGAIGYVSASAGLELNVAIRTLEFAGDRVWIGVGGGIVADSDPAAELAECFVKARPLARVLGAVLEDDVEKSGAASASTTVPAPSAADPAAGVFTTVLVREGRPESLDAHVGRLAASAAELYGHDVAARARELAIEQARELAGTHRLRLEVAPSGALTATAVPLDPGPVSWALVPFPLPGGLGAHKWSDRSALPAGPDEPLLLDGDEVLETGRASLFVVLDDGLHTPPLDGRILPGTMRAAVLERARLHGLPVYERSLHLDELAGASEVFATNALRGIVAVHQVQGVGRWATPGPVASLLSAPSRPVRVEAVAGADVLFVDNHDSFVFNLVQYARELGARATVVRSDAPLPDVEAFSHVVISPGPGGPAEAGFSADAVRAAAAHGVPLLGVCLGHQVIADVFGAQVVRATAAVHGKPTLVEHRGQGVLAGLPTPFAAARYHSLVVEDLPTELEVTAQTGSGIVMGLRHRELPIEGVQFHPESILTRHGHALLAAFLATR